MTETAMETPRAESLQVLLDASSMLLATSSESAVLAGILDLASKLFAADAYAVWRDYDGGTRWRAVETRGLSAAYRREIATEPTQAPKQVQAVEDTAKEPSLLSFQAAFAAEGIRSLVVVPMVLRDGQSGTITFYWHTPRSFTATDRDLAGALGNLSAAALTISELNEQKDRERKRLAFLSEASSMLASSLDYEATLEQVARLAVPHVADWCTVHIVEDGVVNRLVVAHADYEMLKMAKEYSTRYPEVIVPDQGLGKALRTGETQVYPWISDEMLVLAAKDEEHLAALRGLKLTASIVVPLKGRGTVLGAIRLLASGGSRRFTPDDVQLAEDLARRAAAAIENAQLHRAVLEQENQLRLSHAAARMGSWSWNLVTGRIVWSDEFKAMQGLPVGTASGYEGGEQLVHPDDREATIESLRAALASDVVEHTSEHRVVTPDGRLLWVQSRARIERDAAGKALAIYGISIDVTESRLAEEALRKTEKLAAAGRLAATVAHEVNNPLEALMNLIYLASSTEGLPTQVAEYLKIAEDELNRMAHIVRQTLGFYRESLHPQPTDLGGVVSDVVELYRPRATARSIELTCTVEPGLIALVNGGEIKQVMANLVSNAMDATAQGGRIETMVARDGVTAKITVTDTGTGIQAQHASHVFEPFFTTKADVGTGLGLWVSKGIIDKHQGTLTVTSRTEKPTGTTFTVTLPLVDENTAG